MVWWRASALGRQWWRASALGFTRAEAKRGERSGATLGRQCGGRQRSAVVVGVSTRQPSRPNAAALEQAVCAIEAATAGLLDALVTTTRAKNRAVEAAKAKARFAKRPRR